MRFDDLRKARVGILGAGREGQAVWNQLRRRFPDQLLSIFAESAIRDDFATKLDPDLDEFHLGPFDVRKLKKFDVLVRSAGISPYRDELRQLRTHGLPFTTASNLWFAENPEAKTICISGTKGKSTTAAVTAHLLRSAGVRTCLAGNIGRPMLDCENIDAQWWVIELSSYQITDLQADPDIVVLLNLSDEHVDWHGGAQRYWEDKLRLADMISEGKLVANYSDPVLAARINNHAAVSWFNRPGSWCSVRGGVNGDGGRHIAAPASLPGEHNMQNLAAAMVVMDELELNIINPEKVLATFCGLPHRLQVVGEIAGVRYVDDSISTTPVSVSAALETFGYEDVVLLLGGMDRGLDWSEFAASLIGQIPQAIICLPDNGQKILDSLRRAGIEPKQGLHRAENLSMAVPLAQTLVPEQGCILLSPGAPSFPHFRDFEDRGDQFKKFAGIKS